MKNENNYQGQEMDLEQEAVAILKTLLLMEKPYGGSYLAKLLTGQDKFGLRIESHRNIETFGQLEKYYSSQVEDMIHYLTIRRYMEVKDQTYGTLEITDLGRSFVLKPESLPVSRNMLFKQWHEVQLVNKIRVWRQEESKSSGKMPYELFTNYALMKIVRYMPLSLQEIRKIPGLDGLLTDQMQALLDIVLAMDERKKLDEGTGLFRKAFSPDSQKVKELFKAGISVDEIARRQKHDRSKVYDLLSALYEAGEMEIKDWIEKEVKSEDLHKAVEYFKSVSKPEIAEASRVLGIDQGILSLCKAYAKGPAQLSSNKASVG
jgi:hypothetical protein